MTFGERLRARRIELGLSQQELAGRAGLTQTAIAEIEANHTRSSRKLLELARALGVSAHWLATGQGAMADGAREFAGTPAQSATGGLILDIDGEEYARLPVFDIRFAAGAGSSNYDAPPLGFHVVSRAVLRSHTDAPPGMIFGFQAAGDSMEKTICDRNWCFADMRITNLRVPGIYCFEHEGEGLLKRAIQNIEDRTVTLISDNPIYPPQTIKKPERLRVIGRVFMSIHRH